MKRDKWLWYLMKEKMPWIIAALVVLSSNWAANSIQESLSLVFEKVDYEISWLRVLLVMCFVLMVIILIRMRNAFFPPRTRFLRKEENPEKRKHLVLFLSELDTKKVSLIEGIPRGLQLENNLEKDIENFVRYKQNTGNFWRWEMPLRAVRHHLVKLESVTVLCSHESVNQIEWFQQIIERYKELSGVKVRILVKEGNAHVLITSYEKNKHQGFDFENFDELSAALTFLIKEFKRRKIPETDVMIDFTGGQKVTSVVAAAITFNRNMKSQYVQTNPPWGVISYEVLLGSPETRGLGI